MDSYIIALAIIAAAIGITMAVRNFMPATDRQPENGSFAGPYHTEERYTFISDLVVAQIILNRHDEFYYVDIIYDRKLHPRPLQEEGKKLADLFAKWKGIKITGVNVVHQEPI
jgi:hypothetical protein